MALWHRERIERAIVAFLVVGEACRQAQVDFLHGKCEEGVLEEKTRALLTARPLLRITASELSLRAVENYLAAMTEVNVTLTGGGDLDGEIEDASIALGEIEMMARPEAGLEGGLTGFANHWWQPSRLTAVDGS